MMLYLLVFLLELRDLFLEVCLGKQRTTRLFQDLLAPTVTSPIHKQWRTRLNMCA